MFASLPSPVFFEISVKSLLRIFNRFFITEVDYNTGSFRRWFFCEGLVCYSWVILYFFYFKITYAWEYSLQPPYLVNTIDIWFLKPFAVSSLVLLIPDAVKTFMSVKNSLETCFLWNFGVKFRDLLTNLCWENST